MLQQTVHQAEAIDACARRTKALVVVLGRTWARHVWHSAWPSRKTLRGTAMEVVMWSFMSKACPPARVLDMGQRSLSDPANVGAKP